MDSCRNEIKCTLCPHKCVIPEGGTGLCKARVNSGGHITGRNYGVISSIALDPIEKKPLYHFYPGGKILSVGFFGCNMKCPFCQNHEISQSVGEGRNITSGELLSVALGLKDRGNIGIAFTYNEPLTNFEFVCDTAKVFKENNLKTVLVTNGNFSNEAEEKILPYIDAMNIDLKAFSKEGYEKLGGDFETVKSFIQNASGKCHIELTSLMVPGINDSEKEFSEEVNWISEISPEIPLHITRYFPRYLMNTGSPTQISLLKRFGNIALEKLKYVHIGNV